MKFGAFSRNQFAVKFEIAVFIYRTVDVIAFAEFAVSVRDKRVVEIYGIARNDRGGGVVKIEAFARKFFEEIA